MRSSRLLELLLLLQSRGTVTAAELAERLEVSPRTVYRDVEALSAAGVPVYTERGRGGGISLLPGYRADLTGLTRDEARTLFIRATTHDVQEDLGLGGEVLRSALAKMLRAVPSPFRASASAVSERILVDPVRWMLTSPAGPPDVLGTLQETVFADRRVRLCYQSKGSPEPRWRIVDPYGLVYKSGTWYLVADCDQEARLYRVSRASAAEADEAPVRRREGLTLAALWDQLRRRVDEQPMPVRVVARVRRSRLDTVRGACAPNLVAVSGESGSGGDEWAEAELRFPVAMAARILLSFGTDVEIVSPPEVRDDLLAVAADVVARSSTCSNTLSLPLPDEPECAFEPTIACWNAHSGRRRGEAARARGAGAGGRRRGGDGGAGGGCAGAGRGYGRRALRMSWFIREMVSSGMPFGQTV
ncbi:MAG TPA: WYL domain-containing protein [Trebonia sp.]|jgi:predicted DNA-binding transcriptional regulator YafY|nr:WYL domain-containing protein [Trebonia sp.]